LNPVKAKIVPPERLSSWRFGSYYYLHKKRPSFLVLETCLQAAGGLANTRAGRRSYADFLAWLAEDEIMQKELKFDAMCRGWALGSKSFKKELVREHEERLQKLDLDERDLVEIKELQWEAQLKKYRNRLDELSLRLESDHKFASWKVAIAALLKQSCTASNLWIAKQLGMGHPDTVSRYIAEMHSGRREHALKLFKVLSEGRV
jgi:hypothetical protein